MSLMRRTLALLFLGCAGLFAFAQEPDRAARERTRPEHVDISTGDVLLRTNGTRILVMVDTILDRSVPPDGLVDQWFVLETGEPSVPMSAHLADALLVHSAGVLRITTAEQRFEFVVAGDTRNVPTPNGLEAITTRAVGIGLSHNKGQTTISIAQQLDRAGRISTDCEACGVLDPDPGPGGSGGAACGSGGPGSTSCSVTSGGNSCSVSCAAGYYACCNGIAGDTYCRCVRS